MCLFMIIMCEGGYAHATGCLWSSENNVQELVFPFHCGLEAQTQVTVLVPQAFFSIEPVLRPRASVSRIAKSSVK